jgi:Cu/Ag efflux pump CusA
MIIQGEKNFYLMVGFSAGHRKNPESIGAIPTGLPDRGVEALSRVANIACDTGASFI